MKASRAIRIIVAAAGALALSAMSGGTASAQTSIYGLKIEGDVELSGRIIGNEPSKQDRAKLIEYRDFSEQPFGAFGIRLSRPDESYAVEMGGSKIGQDDQEFFLGAGRPGLWQFDFDWNQIPHVYSTNARILGSQPAPNVFTLPTPRPNLNLYNAAPTRDVKQEWDVGTFGFTLTPTPNTDLLLQYTRTKKDGEKPLGMTMGSPGSNFREILEPVDQTIHDFRIKGSWVGEGWQIQGGYALSVFENGFNSVTADNPCFRLTAPVAAGGCADAAAPERGQTSLPPDNVAHTFSVSGAINLPMHSRVTANASYSIRTQDDTFLPHTINPAIANSPLLVLPRQSLDGMVGIFLFNLNATSRPLPPLTLTARYRLYDFNDMSPEIVMPGRVVDNRSLETDPFRAVRYDYTTQNAGLDGRWRFGPEVATTLGFNWERWDRNEHREVPTTDEYGGKLAVDATPLDWLLARLTYRPSFRRISEYNTFAHLIHSSIETDIADAAAVSQSILLRKFDESDRDRQRVDLLLELTPTDVITVTPTASYWRDDYNNSPLGLQEAESWSAGFDVSWAPVAWLIATAGYVYEENDQRQESRSRPVNGTTTLDVPDFNWLSKNTDTYHTFHAGVKAGLIPNVLDLIFEASYSRGVSAIDTTNPLPPRSGTPAQQTTATAKPFPDVTNTLLDVGATLRYRFAKAWSLGLSYLFEKFDETNFRTDALKPFQTTTNAIYLGSDLKDYAAHIVVLSLGYRFR